MGVVCTWEENEQSCFECHTYSDPAKAQGERCNTRIHILQQLCLFYTREEVTERLAHHSFTEDGPTNEFHGVSEVGNMVRFLVIISWAEHMIGYFF